MKAITVRPPWSTAIAAGHKPVENRGRNCTYRGPLLIHAGAAVSHAGLDDPRIHNLWPDLAERRWGTIQQFLRAHHAGHIVAVADLVDCHRVLDTHCCQPWGDAHYQGKQAWHLVLANPRPLPEPIKAAGFLTVPWTLPRYIERQVETQLATATN